MTYGDGGWHPNAWHGVIPPWQVYPLPSWPYPHYAPAPHCCGCRCHTAPVTTTTTTVTFDLATAKRGEPSLVEEGVDY